MAQFNYRAVDASGKKAKGSLEAETARAARARLRSRGLMPLEVNPVKRVAAARQSGYSGGRVPPKELAAAMRQLSVLVGAGLPVVEALAAASEQAGKSKLGRVLTQVRDGVVAGSSLGGTLAEYPRIFPPVAINMIRSGEASGALEVVLERLALLLESRVRLTGRIRSAMSYPIFMFVVGGAILVFLFSYVIPSVTGIFETSGRALPLPTQILMATAEVVRAWGWLAAPALVLLLIFYFRLIKTGPGRRWVDGLKLRLPLIGPVIRRLVLVRYCRTMATLLSAGVTVVDALKISAGVAGNEVYRRNIMAAGQQIEAGASLAAQLVPARMWPPIVSRLVAAGERSARLEMVFDSLANSLEEEVENSVSTLLSLLEPMMIVILGVAVGFVVLSIMLPIFDMTKAVG